MWNVRPMIFLKKFFDMNLMRKSIFIPRAEKRLKLLT